MSLFPNIAPFVRFPVGTERGIQELDSTKLLGSGGLSSELTVDLAFQANLKGSGGLSHTSELSVFLDLGEVRLVGNGYLTAIMSTICGSPQWYFEESFVDFSATSDFPILGFDDDFIDLYPSQLCPNRAFIPPALSSTTYFDSIRNPFDPDGVTNNPPCGFFITELVNNMEAEPFAYITPATDQDGDVVTYSIIPGDHSFEIRRVTDHPEYKWAIEYVGGIDIYPGSYSVTVRAVDARGLACEQTNEMWVLFPNGEEPPPGPGNPDWPDIPGSGGDQCENPPLLITPITVDYECKKRSLSYDVFVHDLKETLTTDDPDIVNGDSIKWKAGLEGFSFIADGNEATGVLSNVNILRPGEQWVVPVTARDRCGNSLTQDIYVNINLPEMTNAEPKVSTLCEGSMRGDQVADFHLDEISISPDKADFRDVQFADYSLSWEFLEIQPELLLDFVDLNSNGKVLLDEDNPDPGTYQLTMGCTRSADGLYKEFTYNIGVDSGYGCVEELTAYFNGINPSECEAKTGNLLGSVVCSDGSALTVDGGGNVAGGGSDGTITFSKTLTAGSYDFTVTHTSGRSTSFSFNVTDSVGGSSPISENKTLEREQT